MKFLNYTQMDKFSFKKYRGNIQHFFFVHHAIGMYFLFGTVLDDVLAACTQR